MYETEDQKFHRLEKRFKELQREEEAFSRELFSLYEELGTNPEEIKVYLSDPSNFTKTEWESIQKDSLDLEKRIEEISNQAKLLSLRKKQPLIPTNALFVR